MDSMGIWLSPLLLLPGAALLILSTSSRFNRIHDEIHHLIDNHPEEAKQVLPHLLKRSTYFKNSLVLLYLSITLFAAAGLLGGITSGWSELSTIITIVLTIIGILCLTFAAILLMKESILSLEIIKSHLKEVKN